MTATDAVRFAGQIAALQGAPGETLQTILSQFAEALTRDGFRVAGVVEVSRCEAEGTCKTFAVRDLTSRAVITFSQDLGVGSTACNLDPSGLAKACEAVERAIEDGADVVVLSKFGKLEAARGGLCDAFRTAILADLPIITTVSPLLADEWAQFAGNLSTKVPATLDALGAWWNAHDGAMN